MGYSMWFMSLSVIIGLLSFAAAIVLFLRARSAATGLLLAGTAIQPLIPFMSFMLGQNMLAYMGIISLAHVCAAAGLLWYALSLPKTAVPAAAVSNQNPLLRSK